MRLPQQPTYNSFSTQEPYIVIIVNNESNLKEKLWRNFLCLNSRQKMRSLLKKIKSSKTLVGYACEIY